MNANLGIGRIAEMGTKESVRIMEMKIGAYLVRGEVRLQLDMVMAVPWTASGEELEIWLRQKFKILVENCLGLYLT